MTRQDEIDSVASIRTLLGEVGLRTTAARLAVVRRLQQASTPLSHAEVAEELVPLGFDKATVFRNLTDLVDAGLVSRTELGDHVWRFELRDPTHQDGQHPHFVCVDCGSVTCLHDVELPKSAQKSWTKVGSVTEILLKGHCTACAK
ncbi:MAG: Fur family transcriptional regulator [Planctomycetaceae bacterium]|nr:Fur family transcriptional regulator [Planctomycetaceae bacterium]